MEIDEALGWLGVLLSDTVRYRWIFHVVTSGLVLLACLRLLRMGHMYKIPPGYLAPLFSYGVATLISYFMLFYVGWRGLTGVSDLLAWLSTLLRLYGWIVILLYIYLTRREVGEIEW
jgi:hypothetical protein